MISRYSSKTPNENNHHANANKIFVTLLSVSSQDEAAAEHIITFRTIAAKLTLITIVVFRVAQSVDRDRAVFGVLRERSPKYNPVFSHTVSRSSLTSLVVTIIHTSRRPTIISRGNRAKVLIYISP